MGIDFQTKSKSKKCTCWLNGCYHSTDKGLHSTKMKKEILNCIEKYRVLRTYRTTLVFVCSEPSFLFWQQIEVAGARSGLYRGWDNNCHMKELISSTVDEAVWQGHCLSWKGRAFFLASQARNFFDFSLIFFFFFFSKVLWIVSYLAVTISTKLVLFLVIPKKQPAYNLASKWRLLKLLGRWGTSLFPLPWLSFCFRFSIMNPHFIPSDKTVQKLIIPPTYEVCGGI